MRLLAHEISLKVVLLARDRVRTRDVLFAQQFEKPQDAVRHL